MKKKANKRSVRPGKPPATKKRSPSAPQSLDAADLQRQGDELAALRRMLHASRHTCSLSVATCNSPALRDHLIAQLRADHPGIEVLAMPIGTEDVFDAVTAHVPGKTAGGAEGAAPTPASSAPVAPANAASSGPSAIFVVDLERSVPSTLTHHHPVLQRLNASRELWPARYACPVVFWLPEYATTLLIKQARDLWSWISHKFEFVSEMAGATAGMRESFSGGGGLSLAANLDLDRKRFRMAELEQRIAEAGDPPPPELAVHVFSWINELGSLYLFLGELDQAETFYMKLLSLSQNDEKWQGIAYSNLGIVYRTRGELGPAVEMYRKSIAINEKFGIQKNVATAYNNLGLIYQTRGELDQAEEMHRKALAINEKIGRQEGIAAAYSGLGLIYQRRGEPDRAEGMHRKALGIHEKLGRLDRMAVQFGNLGVTYRTRGKLDQAEEMHRKALGLNEKLGSQIGIAMDCGNLGQIYLTRGDSDRAEEMFNKSLEIEKTLGRLEGMVANFDMLGIIAEQRGNIAEARALWTKSRDLYAKIGMKQMVQKVQGWLDGLPKE